MHTCARSNPTDKISLRKILADVRSAEAGLVSDANPLESGSLKTTRLLVPPTETTPKRRAQGFGPTAFRDVDLKLVIENSALAQYMLKVGPTWSNLPPPLFLARMRELGYKMFGGKVTTYIETLSANDLAVRKARKKPRRKAE
jgi:hypothetical protein